MPLLLVLLSKALLALVILTVGADVLVRGASSLALRLGVSALAVGLTVVAFGTSAPELVVSVGAALRGASDIAVGNVVGSNICNIGLILGLAALIRPLPVEAKVFRLDAPLLVVVSLLLTGMLLTGGLSRPAGVALLIGVGGYTAATLWLARREGRAVHREFDAGVPGARGAGARGAVALDLGKVVVGLLGLMLGGRLFVAAAVALAEEVGVSQAVIGLTVVAVGTSLPELATSIVAAVRRQGDIAVGNVVGSNIFNILGILGATALVRPLPLGEIVTMDLVVMLLLAVALLPILRTGFAVSRIEGGLLLAAYCGYVAWRLS